MVPARRAAGCLVAAWVLWGGCDRQVDRPPPPAHDSVFGFANGCYTLDATPPGGTNTRWMAKTEGGVGYDFYAVNQGPASRFTVRASDLGTYLFYDEGGGYLVAPEAPEHDGFRRLTELDSDLSLLDDTFISPAEWELEVSAHDAERFQLRNRATGRYLTTEGVTEAADDVDHAAVIALYPSTGCKAFPEMTVDAEGTPAPRRWDDGAVFGYVDAHEHMFTNYGFGGGGIFHGSPFHRLGVEKALPSCAQFHGEDGRRDLVGFLFSGLGELDATDLVTTLISGMTPEFDHHPDGYPTFTDWPNGWKRATHQMQYYRWTERAYRSGLRLLVQHATTNRVLCELIVGIGAQAVRYSCADMVAVDREIEETYRLERYIDAQSGGPGLGWFRVVKTPAEARAVIDQGKLAVILGIETSNLFECLLTPAPGQAPCDAAKVRAELDRYYEKGVRAMFPVHKFDNAFSAGDGDRNVGQIGSFVNSGHWSNLVEDCPDIPSVFDHGEVRFGGINEPRSDYGAPAPNDFSGFAVDPLGTLAPFLSRLQAPALPGDHCQNAGLTALGETLIQEMMMRGMIVEVDHLPRRSFERAYELLGANDYPPAATHGNTNRGRVYQLGGISATGIDRCADPARTGSLGDSLRNRIAQIRANGGYPAEGFAFDLNGFAGAPRPRFGPDSPCSAPQSHPVTYPFTSYAGDVTFTQPHLGNRSVDFNTEGMLHIGLLPELIEDARRDGVTDDELEPLFRSAEAYLRMWEKAESRAATLRVLLPQVRQRTAATSGA